MIDEIILKFGSVPTAPPVSMKVAPVTVFVGPNNSGKSRVLAEIEQFSRTNSSSQSSVILDRVQFIPWNEADIRSEISAIQRVSRPGDGVQVGFVVLERVHPQENRGSTFTVNLEAVVAEAVNPNNRLGHYAAFLSLFTLRLDGTNRLTLLNPQSAGDLKTPSLNHLTRLFATENLRKELRRITFEAFGKYLVIDPTNIGTLSVRLSNRPPADEREEKGWEQASVDFHRSATDIQEASDGVKAFTGILTTLIAGEPKLILIDEPEAFLHPSLSNKLGKEICAQLRGSRKRLFAASHSASFLMGCIQSGAPVNIIRLTYNYSSPTARVLSADKILKLMRNPLLRSTGVLEGLFYEAVVVAESDSDRAFYQEINERLLAAGDPRGIAHCLFLNAKNKQTVWEIVAPLREMGIPAVGIVDIDVLKEGGQVWAKPLEGAFVPKISHSSFHDQRNALNKALVASGKDMKRDGGLAILAPQDQEACKNLFASLASYGIFIVPGGELESWLKWLGSTGHSPDWLVETFEKMGEDPSSNTYVKPGSGDVWDFIGSVKSWISNPNRKGIPEE